MYRRDDLIRTLTMEGIPTGPVLDAIATVPRDAFVPASRRGDSWGNFPVPIGHGQTISQPYTVARMLVLSGVYRGARFLEVGAGSGYLLALAAVIVGPDCTVYGIERVRELATRATRVLAGTGFMNARVVCGDGKQGLPDTAPFDCIVVSAQNRTVPNRLVAQLAPEGRLVIPIDVGSFAEMTVIRKTATGARRSVHGSYSFVPLV